MYIDDSFFVPFSCTEIFLSFRLFLLKSGIICPSKDKSFFCTTTYSGYLFRETEIEMIFIIVLSSIVISIA